MNNKLFIDIETNFDEVIEQAEELLSIAEEMAELKKEETVFECDIQGMKFKGTKSDFAVFIDGVLHMSKLMQGYLK